MQKKIKIASEQNINWQKMKGKAEEMIVCVDRMEIKGDRNKETKAERKKQYSLETGYAKDKNITILLSKLSKIMLKEKNIAKHILKLSQCQIARNLLE